MKNNLEKKEKAPYEEAMITFLMFTSADIITASGDDDESNTPNEDNELGEWDWQ